MAGTPRAAAELVALLLVIGAAAVLLTQVSARLASRAATLAKRIT